MWDSSLWPHSCLDPDVPHPHTIHRHHPNSSRCTSHYQVRGSEVGGKWSVNGANLCPLSGEMEWWHAGREEEEEEEEDCRWVSSLIRGEKCLAEGLTIYTLPMTCLNKECQSGESEKKKEGEIERARDKRMNADEHVWMLLCSLLSFKDKILKIKRDSF